MAGTNLSYPYDEEIFNYSWKMTPDVVLTSMLASGAVVVDPEIANLISKGSNYFVTPFYNLLDGEEQDYNGVTDFVETATTGGSMAGAVYGRMKAWKAISFISDFNSGADPMQQIVAGVANYWQKKRQERLIKILDAVFSITGDADWATHTIDLVTTTTSVVDANRVGETTINNAIVSASGDNAGGYSLAIMHSVVANRLANLQLLNYSKYTDASGIQRALPLGTINGITVLINDNVTVTTNATDATAKDYSTYLLGQGAIRYAQAPVDKPSEMDRDPVTAGGVDMIYTRMREVMHPYGFSFVGDVATDVSVPDAVLTASASYERKMPAQSIKMVKLLTNG